MGSDCGSDYRVDDRHRAASAGHASAPTGRRSAGAESGDGALMNNGKRSSVVRQLKGALAVSGPRSRRQRRLCWAGLVLLTTFAAYALRTSTATLQSMWIDEVMALEFTSGSLADILNTIVQPQHNGPLFYLLLFGWRQLVGDSDFAVRYLSVAFSVVTVPLLYQWARKLTSRAVALTAIWLLVVSPFPLWYAHAAKMYALH
ncbi:MAG: hypothetical protein E3J64_01560, partial [Anaerolineales bacterium]